MPVLSHLHPLFHADTCDAYIHIRRWQDRPLQCPRCHSHNTGPWGMYHDRPGLKRSRCQACRRTGNDLTQTLLARRKRSLAHWLLATLLLCLSCSVAAYGPRAGCPSPVRAIAGVGGCAIRPRPMKPSAAWRARWKRMPSPTPRAARGTREAVASHHGGAERVGAGSSASPGGVTMTKTGRP